MNANERAFRVVQWFIETPVGEQSLELRGRIAAAIREAVNDALERAAVAVLNCSGDDGYPLSMASEQYADALSRAADAIRNLKEPTP